jgi:hypothetical protein
MGQPCRLAKVGVPLVPALALAAWPPGVTRPW